MVIRLKLILMAIILPIVTISSTYMYQVLRVFESELNRSQEIQSELIRVSNMPMTDFLKLDQVRKITDQIYEYQYQSYSIFRATESVD